MTFNSFVLVLTRQLRQKWGRVLLASAGIMVGVWAITLTAGLSFGVSETLDKAVDSQAAAKFFQVYKTETRQTGFEELDGPPKFVALTKNEMQALADRTEHVVDYSPSTFMSVYFHTSTANTETACVDTFNSYVAQGRAAEFSQIDLDNPDLPEDQRAFEEDCLEASFISNVWESFYENSESNWIGQTEKPGVGEIVVCYTCGSLEFNEQMNVSSPEELLGKKITVEPARSPDIIEAGQVVNVANYQPNTLPITETNKFELEIVAVIDDVDSNNFSFTGGATNNFWWDFSYFEQAVELSESTIPADRIGYIEHSMFIDNYTNLESVLEDLRKEGFLATSIIEVLIGGVKAALAGLTVILSIFGLIALIASIFGIINIMVVSVLERKKEIGILKSLGARDGDIFKLFFSESTLLGVFGWLLGTGISLIISFTISFLFDFVRNNEESLSDTFNTTINIKEGLDSFGITSFQAIFPWWLLLSTFAVSVIFTALSGIFPAIKASRENPVSVLRNE